MKIDKTLVTMLWLMSSVSVLILLVGAAIWFLPMRGF